MGIGTRGRRRAKPSSIQSESKLATLHYWNAKTVNPRILSFTLRRATRAVAQYSLSCSRHSNKAARIAVKPVLVISQFSFEISLTRPVTNQITISSTSEILLHTY